MIHRLLAYYFICKKDKTYHVHHINFKRNDNNINNLKWVKISKHEIYHGKIRSYVRDIKNIKYADKNKIILQDSNIYIDALTGN